MKRSSLVIPFTVYFLLFTLSGCTLPWQKDNETEVVVADSSNPALPGDTTMQPTAPTDITPSDTPKAIAPGWFYLPYTSTAVAQAQWQVVLFFHANWSPASLWIDKDITANIANLPKDITILMVNYDDAKELKELYGVSEQPSFVQVDNSGKLIKKWRGGTTLTEIIGQVQK